MDLSSVGAASISMHLGEAMQSISVAMLKKAMDVSAQQSTQMIQSLQTDASAPTPGHLLDTRA